MFRNPDETIRSWSFYFADEAKERKVLLKLEFTFLGLVAIAVGILLVQNFPAIHEFVAYLIEGIRNDPWMIGTLAGFTFLAYRHFGYPIGHWRIPLIWMIAGVLGVLFQAALDFTEGQRGGFSLTIQILLFGYVLMDLAKPRKRPTP